ncbi:MAG TPA: heme-binding protein [Vicinamibacterales bacterium]
MKGKHVTLAVLASAAAVSTYWFVSSRAPAGQARYTLRRRDGLFELREYPELLVAHTKVTEASRDSAFHRLVRYLARANTSRMKIPMITPVLIDQAGGTATMAMVLPEELELDTVPRPVDPTVAVRRRPAALMAVHRFSGPANDVRETRALTALRDWLTTQGLEAAGEPTIAQYDSPVVPGPLRRYEVMIPVVETAAAAGQASETA